MKIGKLKQVADLVLDPGESSSVSPLIALEHVVSWEGRLDQSATLQEVAGGSPGIARVRSGDILFGKLRPYLAKSFLVERDAYASTELLALRAKTGIESRWLGYVAISRPFVDWAVANSHGSKMPRTSWQAVREFEFAIPNSVRQQAIADFLDAETPRIDALIESRRTMLKLIEERYLSMRTGLLLGKFNPVKGNGDPPGDWPNVPLGTLVKLQRGHDLPTDDRQLGSVPVVSSGGVSGRHSVAVAEAPGVITGRYGTVGEVFYLEEPYWPLNTTLYVADFRGNHPRWVFHLLASIPLNIDAEKTAVTGINRNVVGRLRVLRPPTHVQRELAENLDSELQRNEAMKSLLRQQASLLQERRQALIIAAVTGQLDIPGVAA